jgi:mxaJ protein
LRGLRIGVQIIGDDYANSPPATALGARGMGDHVVGFPVYGDYSRPAPLAPIIDAVVAGTVDVALVWGPLGGWYAKHSATPLSLAPVLPAAARSGPADPPLTFDIAMGVRHGDQALKRRLDDVIRTHRDQIEAVLRRFGVPRIPAPPYLSQRNGRSP